MAIDTKVIVVAPLSSISKRLRLFKITKFLYNMGINNFEHIAWERNTGECVEQGLSFSLKKTIILRGGGYGGFKVRLMYLLWMIKVFFISFKIKKTDIVWALGFESAFPLLLAKKIKGFKLYFDDADRFSMTFKSPFPINKLIEKMEIITSKNAYKHLIPVKERYGFKSDKFHILQNTPSKSEVDAALNLFQQQEWIKKKIVININGWLGNGRGMNVALQLYDELENEDVGFILAGKLDCEAATQLALKEKVQYLGNVSNAQALASYFASDFVFTYYNPNVKINRLAASNKWGDAIFTDTGIIVNNEVLTSKGFSENGVTISFPYNDIKNLADEIRHYLYNPDKKNAIKSKIVQERSKISYFEEQLNSVFHSICKEGSPYK
jgi:hypothetical protein